MAGLRLSSPTVATAAANAEMTKREPETGQKNLEQAKQKIEQSTQLELQRAGQTEEKSKD